MISWNALHHIISGIDMTTKNPTERMPGLARSYNLNLPGPARSYNSACLAQPGLTISAAWSSQVLPTDGCLARPGLITELGLLESPWSIHSLIHIVYAMRQLRATNANTLLYSYDAWHMLKIVSSEKRSSTHLWLTRQVLTQCSLLLSGVPLVRSYTGGLKWGTKLT